MESRVKYLVTGGAGFIGSHIVDRLVADGNEVIVIDNESAETHEQFYYNESADYYQYDISKHEHWLKVLFEGVDTVFHCAAEARIQPSIHNPLLTIQTNACGTCSVLQAALEKGVRRFVYSSTSSAYGLKNDIPNTEHQPDDCLTPYSVSKVTGEKLCKLYSDLYGLETVILRYFNVYGERQPLRGPYAPVIGKFLEQEKRGEPLTIVPDGEQRRDYTHVSDIVSANLLASQIELDTMSGEMFNVGTGSNISINELAKLISPNTVMVEPRTGAVRETLANVSKIKKAMGWSPLVKLEDWISMERNKQ
jgi:UDP-glucose 4-epimerase